MKVEPRLYILSVTDMSTLIITPLFLQNADQLLVGLYFKITKQTNETDRAKQQKLNSDSDCNIVFLMAPYSQFFHRGH